MDFFSLGSKIDYSDFNAIVYLLRKFKRLTSDLKLGSSTISSDYGVYNVTGGLTSVGGNFILEDTVTISSNDVLLNCFYTFHFTVFDVNLSGTVNRRVISVTGDTGDDGVLEVVLEPSLLESDEVILPDFKVDIVFDEHEYYTPLSALDITLTVDKQYIDVDETATITATVLDDTGTPVSDLELRFNINDSIVTDVTNSEGVASITYTGVSTGWVNVTVSGESIRFYVGEVTIAEVRTYGSSIILGRNSNGNKQWLQSNGDVIIDWGDGTQSVVNNPTTEISHKYNDRENHNITFIGNVTSLGEHCFFYSKELFSIDIADTVTSLGASCFSYCTNLTGISIPDSVTFLGAGCFSGSGLTSINIPDSVTTIREACFMQCTDLVTVTIPDSVTTMNGQCFQSCTSLTSIVIPSSITLLKYFSFKDCTSLTSVNIPNSVMAIDVGCFDGCTSLIDYQLYWENNNIIKYASNKLPTNLNTTFTIPKDTRINYRNKYYPVDLLEERDGKNIKLSCSTPVLEQYETAVIVATYTDGTTPLTNQNLTYRVTQGATTIDSGSVTTDSNGKANINVIPPVTGEVQITVKNNAFSPLDIVRSFVLIVTETTHNYDLVLTADKSIIDENDTATVTALLTDNNIPVSDKTLTYTVKHGATVIDSGSDVTDSNGEISISYTGTGAGEVEIVVEYSIILQETYEIWDTLMFDMATTGKKSTDWYIQSGTLSITTDDYGTLLDNTGTGNGMYVCNLPNTTPSAYDAEWEAPFAVEFDIVDSSDLSKCYMQVVPQNSTAYTPALNGNGSRIGSHHCIECRSTGYTIYIDDRTPIVLDRPINGLASIRFQIGQGNSLKYKNWKIYSI